MAELAPVKVALLDIGKEQRTKKQKREKKKMRRGIGWSHTPCAQSGSQETCCIILPIPAAALQILTLIEPSPAGS